jgi:hypothetical protein
MKKFQLFALLMLNLSLLTSCSVVEGIFKAGMGTGIFLVLAILVIIVWAISKARRK